MTNSERFFQGIGFRRRKVRRKFAEPQGFLQTGEGMELAMECGLAVNADRGIVVRLEDVEIEDAPGTQPRKAG